MPDNVDRGEEYALVAPGLTGTGAIIANFNAMYNIPNHVAVDEELIDAHNEDMDDRDDVMYLDPADLEEDEDDDNVQTIIGEPPQVTREEFREKDRQRMKNHTMKLMQAGVYLNYNDNIIRMLGVDEAKIPKKAFGIEIELHTSAAMWKYYEEVKVYTAIRLAREREAYSTIPCTEIIQHLTDKTAARNQRLQTGVSYGHCPVCHNTERYINFHPSSVEYKNLSNRMDEALVQVINGLIPPVNPRKQNARAEFVQEVANRMPEVCIAKRDGSLDKDYGIEIVSVPLKLQDARDWLRSLSFLCVDSGATVPTTSYGMHVHVNRRAFMGRAHIMRFFHALNAEFDAPTLKAFLGLGRWRANIEGDKTRITDAWARAYRRGFRHALDTGVLGGKHHDAVSLSPVDTIEVRIFQSSTDYNDTCANLDFVAALLEYTTPGADGGSVVRFRIPDFYRWAMERRYKDFPFLYEKLLKLIANEDIIDPGITGKLKPVRTRKVKEPKCVS